MTKAIGYIRRSSDKQEESLGQQRAKLEAYAKGKGWTLDHVYVDDAISGSDMHRPGLNQMVQRAIEDKEVHTVLAWDRNRIARPKDPMDGMILERKLMAAGKRVIYASTGQEADRSFTSGILSYIEHHQNGDYLRKLSRDTVRGVVASVQRGMWPGGPIPFGYDRLIFDASGKARKIVRDTEEGAQIILNVDGRAVIEELPKGRRYAKHDHEACTLTPSEAGRVRALQKMFADYANGTPTRKLRDDLNASGFRTSRGSRFTVQTILPILENPAYLGRCVYNRRTLSKWHRLEKGSSVERTDEGVEKRPESDWIIKEDAWPAILDQKTFDLVNQRRAESKANFKPINGRSVKANYLLTHLRTCGVCGGRLIGQTTNTGKGRRSRYYVCQNHHKGFKDLCPKRGAVHAEKLEAHILGLIQNDLAKLMHDDQLHKYVSQAVKKMTGQTTDSRVQLRQRQAELDQKLATLREHLKAMDAETAKAMGLYDDAKQLTQERSELDASLAKADRESPKLPGVDEIKARTASALERFEKVIEAGTLEEKREMIGLYVQKIKADPDLHQVHISLYPAIFTSQIAGSGFEPLTSGL